MRVSFTVKVSVRVIQVAILSCNCEATQPRRRKYVNATVILLIDHIIAHAHTFSHDPTLR